MKHYFAFVWLLMLCLISCNPQTEVVPKYPLKTLLHQKTWKVVSMQAERKSDGEVLDWYAQLHACNRDNIFTTEAPGTGFVGELHGEEGASLCQENDLTYIPHIASWKLNENHDIFAVSLFASGHRMLYGYDMKKSYDNENWMVEELNEQSLQVRVTKIRDVEAYEVVIRFEIVP